MLGVNFSPILQSFGALSLSWSAIHSSPNGCHGGGLSRIAHATRREALTLASNSGQAGPRAYQFRGGVKQAKMGERRFRIVGSRIKAAAQPANFYVHLFTENGSRATVFPIVGPSHGLAWLAGRKTGKRALWTFGAQPQRRVEREAVFLIFSAVTL